MNARLLVVLGGLFLVAGCVVPKSKYDDAVRKLSELDKINRKLSQEVESLTAENENLKRQISPLQAQIDSLNKDAAEYKEKLASAEAEKESALQQVAILQEKLAQAEGTTAKLSAEKRELADLVERLSAMSAAIEKGGPITLVVKEALLFDLGKAEIKPKGKAALDEVAKAFKARKELVMIDGHTDDIPVRKPETVKKFKDNLGLASARALAVARYLRNKGIPEKRIFVRGFGEWRPRHPNNSAENRAKNRRVEITFVPPEIVEGMFIPKVASGPLPPAPPTKARATAPPEEVQATPKGKK